MTEKKDGNKMSNVVEIKRPPKAERTQMETMILDASVIEQWAKPPFQRPIKINDRVREAAEQIKSEEAVSGVLTLGVLDRRDGQYGPGVHYLLDGQHRVEAFKLSGLKQCLADVRIRHFDTMADMGDAFVELNSALVTMRPDDVLRGLEGTIEALRLVKARCKFVGYDNVRRNADAPVVGMAQLIRSWSGSASETPAQPGMSALAIAKEITTESAEALIEFLIIAEQAWGRDPEYWRLWSSLNLTVCMWLWRKLVLDKERGVRRYIVLKPEEFKRCLMSLSASQDYVAWLLGRQLNERDRAPCFQRVKAIFQMRLAQEKHSKVLLPQPSWDTSRGRGQKR